MDDEPIPVEVVRDATSDATDGPAAERMPVEWRRTLVPAAAVLALLALVVVAWSQVRMARAAERTTCLQEAQLTAFNPSSTRPERFRELLETCGVDLVDDDDDGS